MTDEYGSILRERMKQSMAEPSNGGRLTIAGHLPDRYERTVDLFCVALAILGLALGSLLLMVRGWQYRTFFKNTIQTLIKEKTHARIRSTNKDELEVS